MRRLIVEISSREFSKLIPEWPIQKVRSMEVLHFLRLDYKEVAMIVRVEFNEPNVSIEDIFPDDVAEVQLLEHKEGKERERERNLHLFYKGPPYRTRSHSSERLRLLTIRDTGWKGKDYVSRKRGADKEFYQAT